MMAQMGKGRFHLTKFAWTLLLVLSAYYLYRAIDYRFLTPGQLGPDLFNKQFWFAAHLIAALPILVGAPLQFIPKIRDTRPKLHRIIGRVYVASASLAALTAIYLGATIELEGSRLPIVMLGCLWLFFTLAAWRTAVRADFVNHRLFMIRSYGLALVLVWLRLLGDIPADVLFFYIQNEAIRDTTLEWLSWVLPLLIVEFWLSWLPMLRRRTLSAV
jgi:uncharacterized membrane protein